MTNLDVRRRIEEIGIIPSIRTSSAEDAHFAAEAVFDGGIPIVEVTMTVPGALDVIRNLVNHGLAEMVVGAGGVWDAEVARKCVDAGAQFLTGTGFDPEVVNYGRKNNVVVYPGVLTPAEVIAAWKTGPDFLKIFPCSVLGGPAYVKALRRPFPAIPFIAAGGVNQQNAAEFILGGARAIGIGTDLIQPAAIRRREASWIHELAGRFLTMVKKARQQLIEVQNQ